MVNFFSYFLTCSNHSTLNDVVSKYKIYYWKLKQYLKPEEQYYKEYRYSTEKNTKSVMVMTF